MDVIADTSYFGDFKQSDAPRVNIIPCSYEYTTKFNKGTKYAPQLILNASKYLELFDEELWVNTSKVGINTSELMQLKFLNDKPTTSFNGLEKVVRDSVVKGMLPLILGGENTLSLAGCKALYDLYPDLSILHLSAAPYLKDCSGEVDHSSTFRMVSESLGGIKIVHMGVRRVSEEEVNWLEDSSRNIDMFFSPESDLDEMMSLLSKNVYISFNFSALDPSIMPTSVFPEPGGMDYQMTLDILKNVCALKEVVGMDFVEYSATEANPASALLAAKLIYKSIGYCFAKELGALDDSEEEISLST